MAADATELEVLYRCRHSAFLNGLAPIAGSYELARDAVQETFVRALRRRRSFRGEGSLEAWVWTIAIRTAIDHRYSGREVPLDEALEPIGLPEPERDPELARALSSLPPRRRLIVFLQSGIAERLGNILITSAYSARPGMKADARPDRARMEEPASPFEGSISAR